MDRLSSERERIDRIDEEMARLFEERMAAAARIAAWKREKGLPVRDEAREQEVLARNTARIGNPALRPHYAAVLRRVMAESRSYQHALLEPEALSVRTAEGAYPIYLSPGALGEAGTRFNLNRLVFIVTDEGIPVSYAQTLAAQCSRAELYTIPQGETSKTLPTMAAMLEAMCRAGLTRSDCVAAVGGGVVGDLAGLAAALYMRGIDFYNVPTTVLAMVDSAVGGKTAVNFSGVKNLIGSFWPPKGVLIDPRVLETLPARQRSNGLAEAVKMALTHDPALFARFEDPQGRGPVEDVIAACLRIKREVVEADEREAGLRRVLNFGHTLGHGIEAAAGGKLLHGECVALGMLPMCAPAVRARLLPVLERLNLPVSLAGMEIAPETVLAAAAHDKKAVEAGIQVVCVPQIGSYEFKTCSIQFLRERLELLEAET